MKLKEYIKPWGALTKLSNETGVPISSLKQLANYDYNIIKRKNYLKISKEKVAYIRDETRD